MSEVAPCCLPMIAPARVERVACEIQWLLNTCNVNDKLVVGLAGHDPHVPGLIGRFIGF